MNLSGFNANDVEPAGDFTPIPAGDYTAIITDSEEKATKAGTGAYLKLTFQVVDGEYKGRNLWALLNLKNPNETAVKIAQGELSSICRAVNVLEPKDSLDLHGIPLTITVGVKNREDTGEPQNVIKKYSGGASRSEPVATSNGSAAPWQR